MDNDTHRALHLSLEMFDGLSATLKACVGCRVPARGKHNRGCAREQLRELLEPAPPAPSEPATGGPVCDATTGLLQPNCGAPVAYVCDCRRCASEQTPEKFHACAAHCGAAGAQHQRIRGCCAEWITIPKGGG